MAKKQKKGEKPNFDYEEFERQALAGIQKGQNLVGENGLLKELMSHLVQSSLEGEMDAFLNQQRQDGQTNRRNGHTKKTLTSEVGAFSIEPPRDRKGDFSPQLVGKWDRNFNSGLDNQVLELYSLGTSVEDIKTHILKMYGVGLSTGQILSLIHI